MLLVELRGARLLGGHAVVCFACYIGCPVVLVIEMSVHFCVCVVAVDTVVSQLLLQFGRHCAEAACEVCDHLGGLS